MSVNDTSPGEGAAPGPSVPFPDLFAELGAASHALSGLVDGCGPDVARTLLRLVTVIAGEAAASERFATALADALGPLASAAAEQARTDPPVTPPPTAEPRISGSLGSTPVISEPTVEPGREPLSASGTRTGARTGARASGIRPDGPFDPYEVYVGGGSDDLQARLGDLDIEELKNIIAQHNLDHDKKAMRWKTRDRLVRRIMDNVAKRSTHGSAFATA